MSRKSRTRFNRRDRRKAKQSGYRRPGRSNPRKVGHGGGGQKSRMTWIDLCVSTPGIAKKFWSLYDSILRNIDPNTGIDPDTLAIPKP